MNCGESSGLLARLRDSWALGRVSEWGTLWRAGEWSSGAPCKEWGIGLPWKGLEESFRIPGSPQGRSLPHLCWCRLGSGSSSSSSI